MKKPKQIKNQLSSTFLLFCSLLILAGCSKDEEPSITEIGEFKIEAQDESYYSFALKKGQTYTLSLDFSQYNYNPTIEADGQRHRVWVDFGVPNYRHELGCELGERGNSHYLCSKSAYCLTPNEDIICEIQVGDDDYSDNTGYALISMEHGSIGFEDGKNNVMIADNNKLFPVTLLPYETTKISVDFSNHTSIPDIEPKGWELFYKLHYDDIKHTRQISIGNAESPKIYMHKESVSIIAEKVSVLSYQIYDSNPSEKNGEVYLNY